MATPVTIAAYVALFAITGFLFLFVNLLVGWLVRPRLPNQEKLEVYECGEPTIGSSFVQFDLRFYVVALLFIIFDVEVAFFFPWAAVFGKSTNLMDRNFEVVTRSKETNKLELTPSAKHLYQEMGVRHPTVPTTTPASLVGVVDESASEDIKASQRIHEGARQLALVTIVDIAAFFAVLLIGFAYVWKRGDLDWVRHISREHATAALRSRSGDPLEEDELLAA